MTFFVPFEAYFHSMKSTKINISLLAFTLILLACSPDLYAPNLLVTGENGYNYRQSEKEWKKLKDIHQNSYSYTVGEQSVSGFGSETTISVLNGVVVSRDYEAYVMSENDGSKEITGTYSESEEDLGSHSEGAPPVILDELYEDCGTEYLMVDPETNTIYFDTNEEGVISLCGHVPELCGDDCFVGFSITKFEWLD